MIRFNLEINKLILYLIILNYLIYNKNYKIYNYLS